MSRVTKSMASEPATSGSVRVRVYVEVTARAVVACGAFSGITAVAVGLVMLHI